MRFFKKYIVIISIIIIVSIILLIKFNQTSEYSNYDRVYESPGTYSVADEYEDVIIVSEGVLIENLTAQTITISSDVINGEIHITNVLVSDTLNILGAGTVYISNSLINQIIVDYSVTTIIIDESSEVEIIDAKDVNEVKLEGSVELIKLYDTRLKLEMINEAYINEFYISSSTNLVNIIGVGNINIVGLNENDVLTYDDSITINNLFYVDDNFDRVIYNVTYYYEEDEIYEETSVYKYDVLATIEEPYKSGYTFEGWLLDGKVFDFDTNIDSDIELYASWSYVNNVVSTTNTVIKSETKEEELDLDSETLYEAGSDTLVEDLLYHKITVNYNNNQDNIVMEVEDGTIINKFDDPLKDGYTFIYWLDEDGNVFNFNSVIDSDVVLTAYYVINTYTVTFEDYIDEEENIVISLDYNSTITKIEKPRIEGYKFVGWYLDESFTEEFNLDTLVTSDLTLYAKYEEIIYYTVRFYYALEDGEFNNYIEIMIEEGNNVRYLDLNIDGYELESWYTDINLVDKFDFCNEIITEDIYIFAKLISSDLQEY